MWLGMQSVLQYSSLCIGCTYETDTQESPGHTYTKHVQRSAIHTAGIRTRTFHNLPRGGSGRGAARGGGRLTSPAASGARRGGGSVAPIGRRPRPQARALSSPRGRLRAATTTPPPTPVFRPAPHRSACDPSKTRSVVPGKNTWGYPGARGMN